MTVLTRDFCAIAEFDLRPGGVARAFPAEAMRREGAERGFPIPDAVVDGEVIEADPPRKFVQTWRRPALRPRPVRPGPGRLGGAWP